MFGEVVDEPWGSIRLGGFGVGLGDIGSIPGPAIIWARDHLGPRQQPHQQPSRRHTMGRPRPPDRPPGPMGHRPPAAARRQPQTRRPARRAARPPLRPRRDRDLPADRQPGPGHRKHRPAPPRPGPVQLPEPVATLARTVTAKPQGPRHHRRARNIPVAVPRRPARTAGQRRPADPPARRPRHPPRPGPQHRPVPARRRSPRRHPRPNPRHQHRRRRHLAAHLIRRLDRLRRRRQPPGTQEPVSSRHETPSQARPHTPAARSAAARCPAVTGSAPSHQGIQTVPITDCAVTPARRR